MPKGKYQRKRMHDVTGGEAGASPAAPTESAPDFQSQVLSLLEGMSQQLKAQETRLKAVEDSGPKYVKATPETYGADYDRYQIAENAPADGMPRSKTVPVTSDGMRVSEWMLEEMPARFGSGSRVRLNLDAIPHGHTVKTRGELMAEAGVKNVHAIGEVIDRTYLSKQERADGRRGVWKYRVKFPSKMLPGSNGGLIGIHEPELIPA